MFSSLATRYSNLKRTLLSDESDGPTEDTTHLSRVLRHYYTEKGRVYPPWLPPDPSSTPTQSRPPPSPGYAPSNASSGSGGLLSDLFDSGPQNRQEPPPPTSLRRRPGDSGPPQRAGGTPQRPGLRATATPTGSADRRGYLASSIGRRGGSSAPGEAERSRSYAGPGGRTEAEQPNDAQKGIFGNLWGNMAGKTGMGGERSGSVASARSEGGYRRAGDSGPSGGIGPYGGRTGGAYENRSYDNRGYDDRRNDDRRYGGGGGGYEGRRF
ncbi:MAG: GTPase activating protein [Vezdaea aestivalis]|nr:MAG: GTPase activating protein [Vezdaea aestivalis]